MEIQIVDTPGPKGSLLPRKELQCPECGLRAIYVRMTCTVDFDTEFYDRGNDIGIGFSMSTANNIETKGEAQAICGNCGQHLELPAGMRFIQDA